MTSLAQAAPRFHTPRNPTRDTFGPAVAKVSQALGRPLMPWQRRFVDVATEVDTGTGQFAYPLVVLSIQRQAGKTALNMALGVHRMLAIANGRVWFTAQTGMHARDSFLEMARPAMLTPLGAALDLKRGAGDTRLEVKHTLSQFRPHPPTEDSLHGKQSDLNLIDEGWAFKEPQAVALMAAITPTQATRPMRQTIVLSTRGTAESVWFHGLIDQARVDPRICFVDYGIGPDDDPADLDLIAKHHPAFGHTIGMDALESAQTQLTPGEFARAYGNRETGAAETIWPMHCWEQVQTDQSIPDDVTPTFAAAVSIDRSQSVVAAAAPVGGVIRTQIIDARPGTDWVPDRLNELDRTYRNRGVFVPSRGPSANVAADTELTGLALATMESDDDVRAASDLYDRVLTDRIEVGSHPDLDTAVANAAWRNVGDGARAFGRRASSGSIAALEAVALAAYQASHRPESPDPIIWSM